MNIWHARRLLALTGNFWSLDEDEGGRLGWRGGRKAIKELDWVGLAIGMDGRGLASGVPDVIVLDVMAIDGPVDWQVGEICLWAGSTLEIGWNRVSRPFRAGEDAPGNSYN